MWTKERVQALLATNDLAVERAVVALHDRQTQDEKRDADTKYHNKRGWRANHAPTLTFYAAIILKGWKQPNGKKRVHLNPNKLANARKVVMMYHKQLCEIANAKEAASTPAPKQYTKEEMDEINRQEDERERKKANFVGAHITEPPPGSYAATARAMAAIMPEFDWDAWKDEMKEGGM